jgi:hypothetical protein
MPIAKAVAVIELSEGHRQQLVPTRQPSMVAVAVVASHALLEIDMGQVRDQLCENGSADIYPPLFRRCRNAPRSDFRPVSVQTVFRQRLDMLLTTSALTGIRKVLVTRPLRICCLGRSAGRGL